MLERVLMWLRRKLKLGGMDEEDGVWKVLVSSSSFEFYKRWVKFC